MLTPIATSLASVSSRGKVRTLAFNENEIFRPIHYLGCKLRTLERLVAATKDLYSRGDLVVDLFSGSTVVSQAYAKTGARVLSVDAQLFCQHMASALLGIKRQQGECSADIARLIAKDFGTSSLPAEIQRLVEEERRLLISGPSKALVDFYPRIPQVWRPDGQSSWINSALSVEPGTEGFGAAPIILSHYAGTYFGVYQSAFFDYVRNRIETLHIEMVIGSWTRHALLTSLYSAMSATVCSAGKHFAQPLGVHRETGNKEFQWVRLHSDRSIDPVTTFLAASKAVDHAAGSSEEHSAIALPVAAAYDEIAPRKPTLIYADPPYTAQQYSRFYHVLEVVSSYRMPRLQRMSGQVTAGLYSEDRYKSPFSSKTAAGPAFEALISQSQACGASLAISYSSSSEKSTGNARMIQLFELEQLCKKYYGSSRVQILALDHTYRPFNSGHRNNIHRNDNEVLILCEA